MDDVFRALADPTRRALLDALNRRNGQTLRELSAGLDLTRQAVTKHLDVLEAAKLVATTRRGREKLHFLNAAPITDIADRWISPYYHDKARTLAELKRTLEDSPMGQTEFVYVTYIETTPEKLFQALTDPEFTQRYWGAELKSDWRPGTPLLWREGDGEYRDLDQIVLDYDPPRRLAYTWHNYQPEHQKLFGWSDEQFAELVREKRSKVSFTLEPAGRTVKLTVIHDNFEPDAEMLKAVSSGWPEILSGLKTLLETGQPLATEAV